MQLAIHPLVYHIYILYIQSILWSIYRVDKSSNETYVQTEYQLQISQSNNKLFRAEVQSPFHWLFIFRIRDDAKIHAWASPVLVWIYWSVHAWDKGQVQLGLAIALISAHDSLGNMNYNLYIMPHGITCIIWSINDKISPALFSCIRLLCTLIFLYICVWYWSKYFPDQLTSLPRESKHIQDEWNNVVCYHTLFNEIRWHCCFANVGPGLHPPHHFVQRPQALTERYCHP